MKKIINEPANLLEEALSGYVNAHSDLLQRGEKGHFIQRNRQKSDGKVALISGGGSGHEPMHLGFVGEGMLDAACPGEVFTSPTPDQILAAAEAVDTGTGVLFVVKNYAGDVMNFEMAAEMYAGESAMIFTDDDVALIQNDNVSEQGNRGVAGTIVVEKITGAAAEQGATLLQCVEIAEAINSATGSMAAALTSCTVPTVGTPTFTLAEDEMELGVGIHGEPGRERTSLKTANQLAEIFLTSILNKIGAQQHDPLLLLCNGLGGTALIELYVLYESAREYLERQGFTVARQLVGNYCTSLDMAGASLTLTRLDESMLEYWDAPVNTPALRW